MEIELTGDRVVLRPFRREELDDVMAGRRRLDRRAHVPTRGARERMRRRIANSGRLVGGWLDLAIDAEGSLVGEIDARHPPRAMPPGVFELGIALFDEEVRGQGYGTEAIALLTAHLFAELGAERVQASTAVDNSAMRRVFEKLGFTKEGVMRSYMPAGESRDDYVLYAVTRADWTAGR